MYFYNGKWKIFQLFDKFIKETGGKFFSFILMMNIFHPWHDSTSDVNVKVLQSLWKMEL